MGRDSEAVRQSRSRRRAPPRLFLLREGLRKSPRADRRLTKPDLHSLFDRLIDKIEHDETPATLTFDEILDGVGRRAYGPLFVIVGLIALSPVTIVPGLTWLFAGLMLLIAVQMGVGAPSPWLPKPLLALKLPREPTLAFLKRMRPKAEKLERSGWLQTRLVFLSAPPLVNLVALAVIAAALVTIPLGLVPAGAVAPNLAIILFGLGMAARDGLWLLLGGVLFGGVLFLSAPLIFGLFS